MILSTVIISAMIYLVFLTFVPFILCTELNYLNKQSLESENTNAFNFCNNENDTQFALVANLHFWTTTVTEKHYFEKWNFLREQGRIESLIAVLHRLDIKNNEINLSDKEKISIGCVATVIMQASQSRTLAEEMLRKGLTAQLLKIVFRLGSHDLNLVNDVLICTLSTISNLFRDSISSDVKRRLGQELEDHWLLIENRFKDDSPPLLKLMIGELLLRKTRQFTDFRDYELFTMEKTELLLLRDSIFSFASSDEFHHKIKTEFLGFTTVIADRSALQTVFNTLLLSSDNRKQLCSKKTFESFFYIVDKVTKNNTVTVNEVKRFQQWVIAASRGLHIEALSCTAIRRYFHSSHLKSEPNR